MLRRRHPVTSLLLLASALALVTFAVLVFSVWWNQERILFQPPDGPWPHVERTRLTYTAEDGQRLFAWVVAAADTSGSAPHGLVLAFHGNAEIAAWSLDWAEQLARRTGATVVLPEYRGYAGLEGTPTYASSALDAAAAWEAVRRELHATSEGTVVYGHSLGSAVAVELAARIRPRAVLLESPFSSARDMASRLGVPGIAWMFGLISRIHFDSRAGVAELDSPVWVAHGTRDIVIPVRMGRDVHGSARVKGELLLVEGAGHNDVVEVGGVRYWSWLERGIVTRTDRPEGVERADLPRAAP